MDTMMISALQRDAVRRALEHNSIGEADIRSTLEALSLGSGTAQAAPTTKGTKKAVKVKRGKKADSGSDGEAKPKRAPSAYNLFVKEHLSAEKDKLIVSGVEKKDAVKQAMAKVGELWKAHKTANGGSSGDITPPVAAAAEEEELELEAINGTEFGYDPKTLIAYNPETSEVVGKMVKGEGDALKFEATEE